MRVFTDGSCTSNGRKGAKAGFAAWFPDHPSWSSALRVPDDQDQTNNRAELSAIQLAVKTLEDRGEIDCDLVIYSDSEYSINCLTSWLPGWMNRGWKTADIEKRVAHIAEILELSSDLKNRASGLTADAKQKISLGRGLVRPDVAAVLFDEPLTVIDPHLKWLLRRKLKEIHHELKLSLIYVTHDQIEALTFAEQVVVMTEGEVVQIGTAQELFEAPAHTFVGYFIGNPGMNLMPCGYSADGVRIAGVTEFLPPRRGLRMGEGSLKLGIRPEFVECVAQGTAESLPARVITARNMGTHWLIDCQLGDYRVACKQRTVHSVAAGDAVGVRLPDERILYYVNERRVA